MKSLKHISLGLFLVLLVAVFPAPAFADDVFTGNVQIAGDAAVNGGNITSTNWMGTLFNSDVNFIQIGSNAYNIMMGNYWGTVYAQGELVVQKTLTVYGGGSFSPNWTDDVTINTDSDSTLILNGLETASGDPLCIDGSNNVIKCGGESARASGNGNSGLEETVKAQQTEIDQLKKDIEELKAAAKH